MSTDLAGLSRKFGAMADSLSGASLQRALRKGGTVGKETALDVAESVAGGDRAITMGGRRKVRLNAGYDVLPEAVAINLRPPGLWVLFESGAKGHPIPKRKRKNAKVLTLANGEYATRVNHPGRSGVRAITKAAGKIRGKAPDAIAKAMVDEMRQAWR